MIKEMTETPLYRTIKEIQPVEKPSQYGFGLPEVVTEYAIDETGNKILQKETRLSYTLGDKVTREEVYDSSGSYCYTKEYFYDDKRRLVGEIDPLGTETRYEYDDNFNKISEEVVGSGLKTFYDYDLGNRLVAKRMVADSGESFEIHYEYDVMNNLTKVIDPIAGVTEFSYDCQGNMIKKIQEPLILSDGSQKERVFTCTYDGIGYTERFTEPHGGLTHICRTSTGLPLITQFPDDTLETCVYREDGKLLEKHIQGGSSEYYAYDNLGHMIFKRTVDPRAGIDFTEEWEYIADRPVKNIDRNGNVIEFHYDLAGRLVEEVASGPTCDKRVTYGYDSLGRQYSVTRWAAGSEYIRQETEVDYLGRTILSRQSNEKGKTLSLEEYEYDWRGNVTSKIRHIDENQTSVELWDYNPFGHVTCHIDPLGNRTTTEYDYHAVDEFGRKGILKTTCDPLGKKVKILSDVNEKGFRNS